MNNIEDTHKSQSNKSDRIYTLHAMSNWFYKHHLRPFAILIRALIRIIFAADVPYQLEIGKGTCFAHDALGSVFHPYAKIGHSCHILHGVTIGGRAGLTGLPVIGNYVTIGAHVQILGPITIGDHAVIGSGAVVIKDVPPYAIVAGVPGRIIKFQEKSTVETSEQQKD